MSSRDFILREVGPGTRQSQTIQPSPQCVRDRILQLDRTSNAGLNDHHLWEKLSQKTTRRTCSSRAKNAASVGSVIALGQFRITNFGDLTWNHEHDIACPKNLIGTVDLFLTTHHGQYISGLPMLVCAAKPRAVVMNNGAKKGGRIDTFQILHHMPTPADLRQLHYAMDAGGSNSPEQFIANLDETTANFI